MKKITIFIVLTLISLSTFAQTMREGRFGTEIYFTPWTPGQTFTLIDGVKARFFINDKIAIRTTLNFAMNPATEFTYAGADMTDETKVKNNWTSFGINPGVEFHFASYNRLSLYAGAEVRLNIESASGIETYSFNDDKIEWFGTNPRGNRSATTLGVGVFTGADYYILSRLYVGAELGLRFSMRTTGETSEKVTIGGTSTEVKNKNFDRTSNLRFICTPAIRLGWNF